MIVPLVLGASCGAGLFVVARGAACRPVPIGRALARLDRPGTSVAEGRALQATHRPNVLTIPLAAAAPVFAGRLGRRLTVDLAVVGRSPEQHAVEKLACSLGLAGIVVAFALLLALGGAALPPITTFALVVVAIAVGFVVPDLLVHFAAENRRAALRHALSSYLDLVNVLLAGGAGIETALEAAAEAGDGWAFSQIRHAVLRARAARRTPWDLFAEVGERLCVDELVEVAASVRLAGEQGARIKLSLAAKAASLRAHQSARIEADANAATERMGLPTVLMFLGFMVLLGYPAVQQIAGSL